MNGRSLRNWTVVMPRIRMVIHVVPVSFLTRHAKKLWTVKEMVACEFGRGISHGSQGRRGSTTNRERGVQAENCGRVG